jgi:SAM-dependent methyltransferase
MRHVARTAPPAVLLALAGRPGASARQRTAAMFALVMFWSAVYRNYRKGGRKRTEREYQWLRTANWEAFTRHYNERVPTIEQELDLWGEYHAHRHEMRYDLLADAVRNHLPTGGRLIDVGCGAGLVADRVSDLDAHYVGFDFGGPNITFAAKKFADRDTRLRVSLVQADGERMPFATDSADVVVLTEVIEHLLRPELAVWEIARVLRPGGVLLMTTNNASEVPLRSPLSHLFAWVEKALGATHPSLISYRPWVWPWPVSPDILPPGSPPVYLPHTHHIQAETSALFAAAGLDTFKWSTFEFPPPQSATARWLEARGDAGQRLVDVIETVAQATPGVRRLGCHVYMQARRSERLIPDEPPPGVWPGPFSE